MRLEDLVPSLELCKRIPAGAFADSALVWSYEMAEFKSDAEYVRERDLIDDRIDTACPAPTLAEILAMMPRSVKVEMVIDDQYPDEWGVYCRELYELSHGQRLNVNRGRTDESAVNAALKLWLELEEK